MTRSAGRDVGRTVRGVLRRLGLSDHGPRRAAATLARIGFEALEPRRLLAAVFWDGGGGDDLWTNAANWSNDMLPAAGDDVTIAAATVRLTTGSQSINSLTLQNKLTVQGGSLSVATTALLQDTLTVNGGTLNGGLYDTSNGALVFANNGNNRIVDLTIVGNASVNGGFLRVAGTLDVSGTFNIGNGSVGVEGSGTLANGAYSLTGGSLGIYGTGGTQTLTLDAPVTVNGFGNLGGYVGIGGSDGNLVNHGNIIASVAANAININAQKTFTNFGRVQAGDANSGLILLNAASWSSASGILAVDGGALTLGGAFNTAGINAANIDLSGGTIQITGTLDNTNDTLVLNADTGSFRLNGGSITGGTVQTSASGSLVMANNGGNRLINLTIDGDADVANGFVRVVGTLDVSGTFNIGNGSLAVEGSGTLNSGTYVLSSGALGIYGTGGSQTLTLQSGVVVRGYGNLGIDVGISTSSSHLVNHGEIIASAAGSNLAVNPRNSFTNHGRVQAGEANTGALTLSTNWSSASGVLAVDGGTLSLGASFSTADLNATNIDRSGGVIQITGALDNANQTLVLDAVTGSFRLNGGSITGGTVQTSASGTLVMANNGNNRLIDLTIDGDADVNAGYVRVAGTLDVSGTFNIGSGLVAVEGDGTLASGIYSLAGGSLGIYGAAGTQTLTIGSGATVSGYGNVGNYVSITGTTGHLVNQGAIISSTAGQLLTINPQNTFTNSGRVQAGVANSGALTLLSNWSSATGVLAVDGGTLSLGGSFNTAGINAANIDRNGGTIQITGTLDNANSTLVLSNTTGNFTLNGGSISGGTVQSSALGKLVMGNNGGNRLINLTIDGDAEANAGYVRVVGTLNVSGTFNIGTGLFAVEGSGTLASGLYTLAGGTLGIYGAAGTQILTLGSGTAVSGYGNVGNYVSITGTVGHLVNAGAIIASTAGQMLTINPQNTFTNHGLVQAGQANTGLLQLNSTWSSQNGALWVDGGTLRLGGMFTTEGINLATFLRNGGNVDINGNLDNSNATLSLNNTTGVFRLNGGTVSDGVIATTDNSLFTFANNSGNRLLNVSINGGATASGGYVRVVGTLNVNGTFVLGNGTLGGEGNATLAGGVYSIASGVLGIWGTGGTQTLTIADNTAVIGYGTIGTYVGLGGSDGNLVINGSLTSSTSSFTLTLNPQNTLTLNGSLTATNNALISIQKELAMGEDAFIVSSQGSTTTVNASFTGSTVQASLFDFDGRASFQGGTVNDPRLLEALGADLGASVNGYLSNFSLGRLLVNNSSYVQLVDQNDNATGAGDEALYVDELTVSLNGTLDLNGLNLYARSATINGSVINGTVITVNDPPAVTLSATPLAVDEDGGQATITATLSYVSAVPVVVELTNSGGSALANTDFTLSSTQITIPAGQLSASATFIALTDEVDDNAEQAIIEIGAVSNATEVSPQAVTLTIVEAGALPTVTLSVSPSTIAEDGGSASITATLSQVSDQDVTVTLAFSGSAALDDDFSLDNSQIVIPAGQLSASITLTAFSDEGTEGDEVAIIDIDSVANATELGTQQQSITLDEFDFELPDLVVNFQQLSPLQLQPGQQAGFTLQVLNQSFSAGLIPANLPVNLYLSSDGELDEGDRLLTSVVVPAGQLAGGASRLISGKFTVPLDSPAGVMQVIALVDPQHAVDEANEANNTDAAAIEVALVFGDTGGDAAPQLQVVDDDGTITTIKLSGGGSGELVRGDGYFDLILRDTTSSSSLKITSIKGSQPGDDGLFVIRNIQIGGSVIPSAASLTAANEVAAAADADATLAKMIAKTTRLIGTLDAPGGLGLIDLAQADGATINIGAGDNPSQTVALKFIQAKNLTINSQLGIKSLQTTRWLDDDGSADLLTAPWLGALKVTGNKPLNLAGDFQADLQLTGTGPKGPALGAVAIAGSLDGATWNVSHGITGLRAAAVGDATIQTDGPIGAVTTSAWQQGGISATSMKSLSVAGNFAADLTLSSSAIALPKARIGGTISGGQWMISGNVANLLAGQIDSDWQASFNQIAKLTVTGHMSGQLTAATLNSLSVGGNLHDATLRLTQPANANDPKVLSGGALSIGGAMQNVTLRAAGHVNAISAQSISDSLIFLGLADDAVDLPTSAADYVDASATLGALTITGNGQSFAGTQVAAGRIGAVNLRTVQTDGDSEEGFAAASITSFTRSADGAIVKLTNLDSAAQSIIDGSFVLRIVA